MFVTVIGVVIKNRASCSTALLYQYVMRYANKQYCLGHLTNHHQGVVWKKESLYESFGSR